MVPKAALSIEVSTVNIDNIRGGDEAREILDALRQIQDSPELKAEAEKDPETVLDRLKLSGIARHAVALGIAGLICATCVPTPDGFW
jgi:hypothetical protein